MARQGLRAMRPTRPAGPALPLALPFVNGAARGGSLDFAPWHAPRGRVARGFRPGEPRGSPQGTRRTKTVVVVAVRRPVVVAVRRADVQRVVVERPATQHTAIRPPSCEWDVRGTESL